MEYFPGHSSSGHSYTISNLIFWCGISHFDFCTTLLDTKDYKTPDYYSLFVHCIVCIWFHSLLCVVHTAIHLPSSVCLIVVGLNWQQDPSLQSPITCSGSLLSCSLHSSITCPQSESYGFVGRCSSSPVVGSHVHPQ
jgi:hypothetical protein